MTQAQQKKKKKRRRQDDTMIASGTLFAFVGINVA
jgi:hypothetical protein